MFRVEIVKDKRPWRVGFSGALTESASIPDLDCAGEKKIELDFSQLATMNSAGVQVWCRWIAKLPKETVFVFIKSPAFLNYHLGEVEGMLPAQRELASFLVPYLNATVDEIEQVEFVFGRHFNERELLLPPRVTSTHGGEPMEIDVTPSRYFAFLKKFFPKITIPAKL